MSPQSLTLLHDALDRICAVTQSLPESAISLDEALHLVLAQPVRALEDIPPFSRSAMDGYAIHERSGVDALAYAIMGESHAGETFASQLEAGQAIRIATGAPVPAGATRVVPRELADESSDRQEVRFESLPEVTFIRNQGEDAQAGDVLLDAGNQLTAGDLSLLATVGDTEPRVVPLPQIAHLTTGDELVAPDQALQVGQIRDSNSALVRGFLEAHQYRLHHQSRAADQQSSISEWIEAQAATSDVLLISGGASVGPRDFPPKLLQDAGFSCEFSRLNLRPGKPVFFGRRDGIYAFVLPGNPGSHLTVLRLLVLPLLQRLSGRSSDLPKIPALIRGQASYQPNSRHTFMPGHLVLSANGFEVTLNRWQSSGDVVSLAGANALVEISPDGALPGAGSVVNCIPLYDLAVSKG